MQHRQQHKQIATPTYREALLSPPTAATAELIRPKASLVGKAYRFVAHFPILTIQFANILFPEGIYSGHVYTNSKGLSYFEGQGNITKHNATVETGSFKKGLKDGPFRYFPESAPTIIHYRMGIIESIEIAFYDATFSYRYTTQGRPQLMTTLLEDNTFFNQDTRTIDGSRDKIIKALCNHPAHDCGGTHPSCGLIAVLETLNPTKARNPSEKK